MILMQGLPLWVSGAAMVSPGITRIQGSGSRFSEAGFRV